MFFLIGETDSCLIEGRNETDPDQRKSMLSGNRFQSYFVLICVLFDWRFNSWLLVGRNGNDPDQRKACCRGIASKAIWF
jgi:hypothetical protein